jgi:hypothetical protein
LLRVIALGLPQAGRFRTSSSDMPIAMLVRQNTRFKLARCSRFAGAAVGTSARGAGSARTLPKLAITTSPAPEAQGIDW